jgi:anti-sigma regulatory factor (Ser/Thr protein kinase)
MAGTAGWSMVKADAREALTARHAVREFLEVQADGSSDLDAVETIVGELVANVIRHADGPIGIHVSWEGDSAVAIVADRGPGIPVLRPVPGRDDTCGRGLMIVQALAKRVEISARRGSGSRVVVELPVHRQPVARVESLALVPARFGARRYAPARRLRP